jgi:hypothetical protein
MTVSSPDIRKGNSEMYMDIQDRRDVLHLWARAEIEIGKSHDFLTRRMQRTLKDVWEVLYNKKQDKQKYIKDYARLQEYWNTEKVPPEL